MELFGGGVGTGNSDAENKSALSFKGTLSLFVLQSRYVGWEGVEFCRCEVIVIDLEQGLWQQNPVGF